MKKEFSKFQIPKEAMNELKGGRLQRCHCGGTVSQDFITWGDSYDELEIVAGSKCGDASFGQPITR